MRESALERICLCDFYEYTMPTLLGWSYVSTSSHFSGQIFSKLCICNTSNVTVSFWLSIYVVAFLICWVTAAKWINVNVCQWSFIFLEIASNTFQREIILCFSVSMKFHDKMSSGLAVDNCSVIQIQTTCNIKYFWSISNQALNRVPNKSYFSRWNHFAVKLFMTPNLLVISHFSVAVWCCHFNEQIQTL